MTESTHFAPLEVVLPDVTDQFDQCVTRLHELLDNNHDISRVHVKRHNDKTGICVHYDPDAITLERVQKLLELAGAKVSDRYQHVTLHIRGMDCTDCTSIIEHMLEHMPGVIAAKVGYGSQTCRLEFDSDKISLKKIIKRLKQFGYPASLKQLKRSWWQKNHEIVTSVLAGVFLFTGWLLQSYASSIGFTLLLLSFATGGYFSFHHSLQTLSQKRFDVDVLMVIAAIGAAALGAWHEGALLLFLFSLGHALEHKAIHHAKHNITALKQLAPKTAIVQRGTEEIEIARDEIQVGDDVLVKPGERIAVDGIIKSGTSHINQAPITGESMPISKQVGDHVYAGTINGENSLVISSTKASSDSTLSRMVELVLSADTQKSPTQRFTDKFVKIFVPVVLLGVIALIVIPPLFGVSWHDAFYRAMAVLVAASPCALAISTPAAVLSGVARAAQNGVLIKGGMHLENLGNVIAVAFDKTGTLTQGRPIIKTVIADDKRTLLQLAASIEKHSGHPIAQAIVNQAHTDKIELIEVESVESVVGKGVRGTIDGQPLTVGRPSFFDTVPIEIQQQADQLQSQGQTVVVIKQGANFIGMIGLADAVRRESKTMLEKLHQFGIKHTIMLTGDNHTVANTIANEIGIDHVKAELLPEDKLSAVSALEQEYQHIAMVGDGVNDAPAMARATVGIAMGGAGTDVALEAADIALMADDLQQLPFAIRLGRRASNIIRINLWFSLGMVAILLLLTATGLTGIGPAIIAHEGSTFLVVVNALRLLSFK